MQIVNLEELYLSHNGVLKIEGLDSLANLRILDLASNRISVLENVSHLENLEELWLNNNKISDYDDLDQVKRLEHLTCVYLEGNPLQVEHKDAYRDRVLTYLPGLTQLDATAVNNTM